jgi:hypothetical protein
MLYTFIHSIKIHSMYILHDIVVLRKHRSKRVELEITKLERLTRGVLQQHYMQLKINPF